LYNDLLIPDNMSQIKITGAYVAPAAVPGGGLSLARLFYDFLAGDGEERMLKESE
jgi:hypothetical protein